MIPTSDLIIAYDQAMLEELGAKPNASPLPNPTDPSTPGASALKRTREYLEGILSLIGGNPAILRPGPKVTGGRFTQLVVPSDIAALKVIRSHKDASSISAAPTPPPNPGNTRNWLAAFTHAIYLEVAKKSKYQPLRPIRRVAKGSDEAKIVVLMAAIAKKL